MPRRYDFSKDGIGSHESYIWRIYDEPRSGRGEVSTFDLWGPGSIFLMSGQRHQFELNTPSGINPYDNAVVDPVFAWLDENATGPWHWIEGETNNNRSVYTNVFLQEDADISAFQERWGDMFDYTADYTKRNARWRRDEARAEERGEIPASISASQMRYIMIAMKDEAGPWFDKMKIRSGFDDLFVEGFEMLVRDYESFSPSEHGPRMLDGKLHEGLVQSLSSLGAWIASSASDGLKTRLAEIAISDSEVSEAIGDFAASFEPPAAEPTVRL